MPVRSILLALALVLVLPASALAAGTLTVSISGAGGVSGGGIECTKAPGVAVSGTCSATQAGPATITAAPAAGFVFDGWSGACTGTSATCALDMDGDRSVGAGFRDVQPPAVTLAEPLAGPVSGPMPVTAAVTDNGQIERVEFTVGNAFWKDAVAPYGSVLPVPTALFPDGPVRVTATAYDKAGNFKTVETEVVYDNTQPEVSVTGPDREAFAPGSTVTWNIGASDGASGIAAARCSVVPNGAAPVFLPCSGDTSHSVSGLPEGRYAFTYKAKDRAGHFAETTRFFRIEIPVVEGETAVEGEAADGDFAAPPAAAASFGPASATAAAPPVIAVALGFRYASLSRATKLSNFVVRNVPAGATVTVRCLKGCGKKSLRRAVKRGGRISLKALARRPLKVDTTITVIVSKPGHTSAVKVLEIRARMAPLVTTQCQPEGASEPVAC